jgi:hypothetical protein
MRTMLMRVWLAGPISLTHTAGCNAERHRAL